MTILEKNRAPRYARKEGITSYLLASPRTSDAKYLTTSQVEIHPGGEQRVHSHAPEQVYSITSAPSFGSDELQSLWPLTSEADNNGTDTDSQT